MNFSPTAELASLLVRHGFEDKTESMYPENFELMQSKGQYDPCTMKRFFQKGWMVIIFDCTNFQISNQSGVIWDGDLTELQLKSVLYYASVDAAIKEAIRRNIGSLLNIGHYYTNPSTSRYMRGREKSLFDEMKQLFDEFKI